MVVNGGTKPYEFSVNHSDFTYSSVFSDMEKGMEYLINVRDKNNCEAITYYQFLGNKIVIPPYFTPNNDGLNDTWEVAGIEAYPMAEIYIYDRFGKLLKKYYGYELGWDGIYLGKLMPSTDYWYIINIPNVNKYVGHFTLLNY